MDYDHIIQTYHTKYSHLATTAPVGSIERHADEPKARQIMIVCANGFARETGFNGFTVRTIRR